MSEATLEDVVTRWQSLADGGLSELVAGVGADLAAAGQARARENAKARMTMRSWDLWESIDGEAYPHPGGIQITLQAGEGAPHAVYQELGTEPRISSTGGSGDGDAFSAGPAGVSGGVAAKHYLRDAHLEQKRDLVPQLIAGIAEALSNGR